jgi:hypothetical protein
MRPRLATLLLAIALLAGALAPLTTRLVAQSVENLAEDPALARAREIEALEDSLLTLHGEARYAEVAQTAAKLLAIDPGNRRAVLYKDMAERKLAAGHTTPQPRREIPVPTAAPQPTPVAAAVSAPATSPPPVYIPRSAVSTNVLVIALVVLSVVLVVVVVTGVVMLRRARAAAAGMVPISDARTVPNPVAPANPRTVLADLPTVQEPVANIAPPPPRVEAPAVTSVRSADAPKAAPVLPRAEPPRSQDGIALPSVSNSSEMQLGEFSTAVDDGYSDSQAPDIDRTKGDTFRKSPGGTPFAAPAAGGGVVMAPPPMPPSPAPAPAASASAPSSAIFVPGAFSAPAPAPASSAANVDPFAAPPPATSAPSAPSGFAPKGFAPAPVPPSSGATMNKPLVDLPKPAAAPAPAPDPFAAPPPAAAAPAANEMTFNTMMFGSGAPPAAAPDPFAALAPKAPAASGQDEATIGIGLPGMAAGGDISEEKTIAAGFTAIPTAPKAAPKAPALPASVKPNATDEATLNLAAGSKEVPRPGAAPVPAGAPASGGSMFQRQYDAGKAAFDAGDFGKAVQCLSVAASLKPGDASVRKLLEEARRQRKA